MTIRRAFAFAALLAALRRDPQVPILRAQLDVADERRMRSEEAVQALEGVVHAPRGVTADMFVVFILRGQLIRPLSARYMQAKEVQKYEQSPGA